MSHNIDNHILYGNNTTPNLVRDDLGDDRTNRRQKEGIAFGGGTTSTGMWGWN